MCFPKLWTANTSSTVQFPPPLQAGLGEMSILGMLRVGAVEQRNEKMKMPRRGIEVTAWRSWWGGIFNFLLFLVGKG